MKEFSTSETTRTRQIAKVCPTFVAVVFGRKGQLDTFTVIFMFDNFSYSNVAPATILSHLLKGICRFIYHLHCGVTRQSVNTPRCVLSNCYFDKMSLANSEPLD